MTSSDGSRQIDDRWRCRRPPSFILLGGWLLMQLATGDPRTTPVREWSQVSAFDTAQECQSSLGTLLNPDGRLRVYERGDETPFRYKCVPSEAIYPPAKN